MIHTMGEERKQNEKEQELGHGDGMSCHVKQGSLEGKVTIKQRLEGEAVSYPKIWWKTAPERRNC